jgi:hypothetical protein
MLYLVEIKEKTALLSRQSLIFNYNKMTTPYPGVVRGLPPMWLTSLGNKSPFPVSEAAILICSS